ncbi:MAG: phosphonate C-P lyase system protein PhnH [Bradyrhizobiaceae bacterium]|nr:phosphonate C-P lyase system protein PhnH [Bradyrhizobiaceae bacterium]
MLVIAPAFADPVSANQATFRAVMDAFARPGSVRALTAAELAPPPPLSRGAAAVALALLDYETPVWLDTRLAAERSIADWLRFHTGAPLIVEPGRAAFAFIDDAARMPPFEAFSLGSEEYPDRSTTLVIRVDGFGTTAPLTLTGPGIAGRREFSFAPAPADFPARLIANRALFPRGVDLLFVADEAAAALPRSTRLIERA